MKHEWRKHEKKLYLPKIKPEVVKTPKMKYFAVSGEGNPNSEAFSNYIEALYAFSYGVKMLPKKGFVPEGYFEYTVYPLEGVWNLNEEGKKLYTKDVNIRDLKDYLVFTLMIRQPEFVDESYVDLLKDSLYKKKKNNRILEVQFIECDEELTCQIMHIGEYDTEPESFKKMEDYLVDNGYQRVGKTHREIYISDPRKTMADKLKTTLRINIREME